MTFVWGGETLTFGGRERKRLEKAFEMGRYRRMLSIYQVDRVPNEEMLRRIAQTTELLNTQKRERTSRLAMS